MYAEGCRSPQAHARSFGVPQDDSEVHGLLSSGGFGSGGITNGGTAGLVAGSGGTGLNVVGTVGPMGNSVPGCVVDGWVADGCVLDGCVADAARAAIISANNSSSALA